MLQVAPSPNATPVGRMHGRRSFGALRADGTRRRSGPITVTAHPEPQAVDARVGYAIGRPVGNAVQRNRLRRRLRAIVRELGLAPGTYLVGASPAATALSFDELAAHLRRAVGQP